jgi:LmbE family N-acetylglucosaminyl deacetylase
LPNAFTAAASYHCTMRRTTDADRWAGLLNGRRARSVGGRARVVTRPDIGRLGDVLGVWAHPDDESYLSAATMIAAKAAGRRVAVVTATYGELGVPPGATIEPSRMAVIRREEMRRAMDRIGVDEHYWLDLPDGGCHRVPPAGPVAAIRRVIETFKPDTVLAFGPDGMTGHADHRATSRWATAAVGAATIPERPIQLLYATSLPGWMEAHVQPELREPIYGPDGPPRTPAEDLALDLRLTDALLDAKMDVMSAHASQTSTVIELLGVEQYRRWISREVFRAPTTAELWAHGHRSSAPRPRRVHVAV